MAVKFKDVPEHYKYPVGPYRQAPAEYGGEWWLVDFTTGPEPWLDAPQPSRYPEGFLMTFGSRPVLGDYRGLPNPRMAFQADKIRWEQDLRFFVRAGWPDDPEITEALLKGLDDMFGFWGMGKPRPYLGRYDHRVRFPESQLRDFEAGVYGVIRTPHLEIARYQARLVNDFGIVPEERHPFVPPHIWPEEEAAALAGEARGRPAAAKSNAAARPKRSGRKRKTVRKAERAGKR